MKVFLRRIRTLLSRDVDRFLGVVRGVIHVGGSNGGEADSYAAYDLNVLWIEPLPEAFAVLSKNIQRFPRQQALKCLVTDKDYAETTFHVSSNEGQSSSVFDFGLHTDLFPEVTMTSSIVMTTRTLPTLLSENQVPISKYDALVLDTQGSELVILKGAASLLSQFRYIKVEAADFASYRGGCQDREISSFLLQHHFRECGRQEFARQANIGSYFNIVYRRTSDRKLRSQTR